MKPLASIVVTMSVLVLMACSDHRHDHNHLGQAHGDHESHEHWHEHSHASDHHHDTHAHTHGQGELEIVLEDRFLLIRAELPAGDIFGFEHEPRTDQERAQFAEHEERLGQGHWLIPPSAAGCSFLDARVSFGGSGEHSDLLVSLRYECERLNEVRAIRIGLFDQYPSLDRIAVVWLSQRAQGVTELSKAQSVINIISQ